MLNTNETALAVLTPETAIQRAKETYQIVKQMRESVLVQNVDYGAIPGTDKPTLLKPGAEKLVRAFGYCPLFETVSKVEQWDDETPLFHYEIRCRLIRIEDGKEIATGLGSCNSKENRYRWRWVEENEIPAHLENDNLKTRSTTRSEFAFAIDKAETTGPYGKPAEYWNEWKRAIEYKFARPIKRKTSKGKEMDAWEMGNAVYRIPNDEVFSLVNTIEKMASKRALIAAVLIGTNASEFFTQDMEDLRDFGEVDEDGVILSRLASEKPTDAPQSAPVSQPAPQVASSPYAFKPPQKPVYGGNPAANWSEDQWTKLRKQMRPKFQSFEGMQKAIERWIADGTLKPGQQTVEEAFAGLSFEGK